MSCLFKAIADPARRTILRGLEAEADSLAALVDFGGEAARVDLEAHLRVLRQAGLVREDRHGGRPRYVVDRTRLHELAVFLRAVVED